MTVIYVTVNVYMVLEMFTIANGQTVSDKCENDEIVFEEQPKLHDNGVSRE